MLNRTRLRRALGTWITLGGLLVSIDIFAEGQGFGLSVSLSQNVDLANSPVGASTGSMPQGPPLVAPGVMDFGPPDLPPPGEAFGPEPAPAGGLLAATGGPPVSGGTSTTLAARVGVQPGSSLGLSLGVNTTVSPQVPTTTTAQALPSSAPQPDTTILMGEMDIALVRGLALSLMLPVGLQNGIFDPSAGFRLMVPLRTTRSGRFFLVASTQATVPLSSMSQQQGKITTIQGTLNPSLTQGSFLLGATLGLSYSFYSPNSAPTPPGMGVRWNGRLLAPPPPGGPPPAGAPPPGVNPSGAPGGQGVPGGPPAPDLFTAAESASMGFRITPGFLLSTSAGLTFTRDVDDSIHWATQITALSLNYSVGMLTLGAALTFVSDPSLDQQASPPSRPSMTFSLGYLFGNPGALLPPGMAPTPP